MSDRRESLSVFQLLPNVVTILGLCAGLTAIRFLLVGRYDLAAMLLIFAAAIDGLDGLLARRLNATTHMGAELDSLSDFLNFGVVPGVLVFQFALAGSYGTGWVFVLVYAICACLRLARFNVNRDAPPPPSGKPHFVGVPSPGGAMLALFPLFLTLLGVINARDYPVAYAIYLGLVGLLMASKVPTLSSKALRIRRDKSGLVLIGAAIVVGLAFTRFWLLIVLLDAAYLAVTLYAVLQYLRGRRV